ncbi:MAG: hypothetical protein HFJ25_01365 [Clostridia bacterium]|nr:hypothetical protein [Clostridia bacterium]
MEENNIIICEKCYEENEVARNTCKKCGAKLYKNNVENGTKEDFHKKKTTEQKETTAKEIEYIDSSNSSNTVADKFILVVMIIKFIGYVGAVISAIILIGNGEFGVGILAGLVIAIVTWFSTLLFEAIAEGLNLLQDIKNKL